MKDKVEIIGRNSIIQHGKHNQRIYLLKLHRDDAPNILPVMQQLAEKEAYGKIFCKVDAASTPYFFSCGYHLEAMIPAYYRGESSACFVSKFLDTKRAENFDNEQLILLAGILNEQEKQSPEQHSLSKKCVLLKLEKGDAQEMAKLFSTVFESYPFPITDEKYIAESMEDNVVYYGIREKKKLVAIASAEIDREAGSAEMTDFAVLPSHRGKKFSVLLLDAMEKDMKLDGIRTLYTIARLNSVAMNRTFLRMNYEYAGTLINNTNIAGKIESMNVLYKSI